MTKQQSYILLICLFLVAATPLLWVEISTQYYETFDEVVYHYPAIQKFLQEWPHFDLVNYELAMTPLYHLVMVFLMKLFGLDLIGLRAVNLLIGLATVLVIFSYLARNWDHRKALIVSLVLMLSPYFLGPSIRLSTDNMGFLFALLTLLLIDNKNGKYSAKTYLLASGFAALAVLTRHLYIWLAVAGVVSVLLHGREQSLADRIRYSLFFLIPIAVLIPFFVLWGDFVPPLLAGKHKSTFFVNLDVIVYGISVLGLLGTFYLPWFLKLFRESGGKILHVLLIGAATSLLLIVHPVRNAIEAGTGDGFLWKASAMMPSLFSTSLAFWGLFPLGLCYFWAIYLSRKSSGDYFFLIAVVLWLGVNNLSALTWHKYYEPFLLFFIGYSIRSVDEPKICWAAPAMLGLFYFGVDLFRYVI